MRLLILGTGWMAQEHARQFGKIDGVELAGAVDVERSRVDEYSDTYGIPERFTSLEAALAWGKFDAAANVTPDRIHHPTTMMLRRGRQARVLRKAAGDRLRPRRWRWPTPRSRPASSTWST